MKTETEQEQIFAWRMKMFENLGYNPVLAAELAANTEVDRAQLEKLLCAGCNLETAAWILS